VLSDISVFERQVYSELSSHEMVMRNSAARLAFISSAPASLVQPVMAIENARDIWQYLITVYAANPIRHAASVSAWGKLSKGQEESMDQYIDRFDALRIQIDAFSGTEPMKKDTVNLIFVTSLGNVRFVILLQHTYLRHHLTPDCKGGNEIPIEVGKKREAE
jgi:hypothetical protein